MSPIPFVRDFDFVPGRPDRLSPLVERVICDNPGPFTFTGTGTYVVGRATPGAAVAVIDPGPDDAAHLAALLDCVSGRTVSHVLVTHTHRDHAPLARPFAQAVGAQVLAARPPEHETHASGPLDEDEDRDFRPDAILADSQVLAGDGWTLTTLATPGHASNHLCFALEEEAALFSGDHVMGWSTTVVAPPDGDMAAYMDSLERVMARPWRRLYPTHGAPVDAPAPFLEAYRAHRLARETQVLGRLAAGDRTIGEITPHLYATVDRRLWPAAALSVHAHLIKLVREGRVAADPAPELGAAFRLAPPRLELTPGQPEPS